MQFQIKSGKPDKQRGACIVVGVFQSRRLSAAAEILDQASNGYLAGILKQGELEGEAEQILTLYKVPNLPFDRVMLVGCGPEREFSAKAFRNVNAAAAKALEQGGAGEAVSCLPALPLADQDAGWKTRQAVMAIEAALYTYDETKSEKTKRKRPLKKLTLLFASRADATKAEQGLLEGQAIAGGVSLARYLGNLPANICTPDYLADTARDIKKGNRKVKVNVLDKKQIQEHGMGALLSVARGSEEPPRLIALEYSGGKKNDKPVVLVGKGITFDTGGISLKPGAAMDEMKFDMCGSASVLGTLKACADMELPMNVVGLVAAAENMPDGRATKPGDIVTTMSGQTVEILNTDAEGRLVLCDALTYAERYNPSAVIDIATLTGAVIVALGTFPCGLLSNHQPLASDLLQAGDASGDRAWQLPLWDDYQDSLKSNFADMANIGGRSAGTITAACFLSRYTGKYPWAHLDVAGTAWHSGDRKGATGRPVPLLIQYLLDKAQ